MTDGQKAFLDYMVKYHGREYAMDMGIEGMSDGEVFYSIQEEMNVNNYEKEPETEKMYNDMNIELENIMAKHYKSLYDMR
tara:strand:- start:280 stop:519 length:240 start_codon:yes stop_codon:yes gene_type:complete